MCVCVRLLRLEHIIQRGPRLAEVDETGPAAGQRATHPAGIAAWKERGASVDMDQVAVLSHRLRKEWEAWSR